MKNDLEGPDQLQALRRPRNVRRRKSSLDTHDLAQRRGNRRNVLPKIRHNEYWAGIFRRGPMATSPTALHLESQARLDRYSGTQTDWAARSALLYAIDETHNHIVRIGASRGYRTGRTDGTSNPVVKLLFLCPAFLPSMFTVVPADKKLKNETTCALEAGYTGRLSLLGPPSQCGLDAYFQRMDHISEPIPRYGYARHPHLHPAPLKTSAG